MFNYQRGDLTGVSWLAALAANTPVGINQIGQGFAASVALGVKDQDLDLSSLLIDVTTTLSGGGRARLAALLDASATITAEYDADQSPYLAIPNIVPGAGGLLVFAITAGATRGIQVPMRIEKVHWSSGTEKGVMYSFDAKMDSRVGLIVYPAA